MTFFETVEHLVKNNENFDWDYYRCHKYCRTAEEVFANPNLFINETFLYAKKNLLVATAHDDRNRFDGPAISSARAAHSVSSFFIGFILAQGLLGDEADSFCQIHETENGNFPFTYVWNLTCLYHDFGYEFENDNNRCEQLKYEIGIPDFARINPDRDVNAQNHYRTFNAINKFFSIKQSYFQTGLYSRLNREDTAEIKFILNYIRRMHSSLLCNGGPVIFPTRTALQIERYLNYRLFGYRHSCIDHGILGGLSFFDLIIKNYIKEYKENKEIYHCINFTDFSVTNSMNSPLRLTIEQTLLFAYISDCIINHNIWKCPKGCERLYREYGLDALIGYRFKKIDFYKNPLLFLLVIADTLEPYKNYCNAYYGHTIDEQPYDESKAIAILKDYNLEVTNSRIIITVPDNYIGVCEERLKDMQDWISIEYTKRLNEFYIRPVMTY